MGIREKDLNALEVWQLRRDISIHAAFGVSMLLNLQVLVASNRRLSRYSLI